MVQMSLYSNGIRRPLNPISRPITYRTLLGNYLSLNSLQNCIEKSSPKMPLIL